MPSPMARRRPGGRILARTGRQRLSHREAQLVGLLGFVGALALPFVLWHRAMSIVARDFRIDGGYFLMGWTGYALIGVGLLCLVPVVASIGRQPGSRFYPRSRNAYATWGVSLYLLGLILASQVAAIARVHPVP
jgi:hypothetical protein